MEDCNRSANADIHSLSSPARCTVLGGALGAASAAAFGSLLAGSATPAARPGAMPCTAGFAPSFEPSFEPIPIGIGDRRHPPSRRRRADRQLSARQTRPARHQLPDSRQLLVEGERRRGGGLTPPGYEARHENGRIAAAVSSAIWSG
jgi:hypothetical protein